MSWLESAYDNYLRVVNPAKLLEIRKSRERLAFSYDAAKATRNRRHARKPSAHPDDAREQRDRVSLMWQARDLCENVGFADGVLRKYESYCTGGVQREPNTGSPRIDTAVRDYWMDWCRQAHYSKQFTFQKLFVLAANGMIRDCDSILYFRRDSAGILRLVLAEADQIGEISTFRNEDNYVAGAFLNPDGSIRGWRIYDRVHHGRYANPRFVDAANAVLLRDTSRYQIRGVTAFASAINNIRDKAEILGMEKQQVKKLSSGPAIITYTQNGLPEEGINYDEAVTRNGEVTLIREEDGGGYTEFMGIGEKFEVVDPKRPSATFSGFLQTLDHDSCQGINLPFSFVVDSAQTGGAPLRIDVNKATREFTRIQRDVLIPALDKIYMIVIADAFSRGELPARALQDKGKWAFPAPPTADLKYESDVRIREYRAGMDTLDGIFGEVQRDWERELIQRAKEQKRAMELAEEYGVPVDKILPMTDNPSSAQMGAPPEPAAEQSAQAPEPETVTN